jgi:hypothetical protein
MGAKKQEDCTADCSLHKYLLQARYKILNYTREYSIEDEVIVTSMKRFYKRIDISLDNDKSGKHVEYHENVFRGVSFKDNKGIIIESKK